MSKQHQKGVVHLLSLEVIGVLLILGVVGYLFISGKLNFSTLFSRGAKVELKEEYKNPFSKETQYVNPFDEYKNPFVTKE